MVGVSREGLRLSVVILRAPRRVLLMMKRLVFFRIPCLEVSPAELEEKRARPRVPSCFRFNPHVLGSSQRPRRGPRLISPRRRRRRSTGRAIGSVRTVTPPVPDDVPRFGIPYFLRIIETSVEALDQRSLLRARIDRDQLHRRRRKRDQDASFANATDATRDRLSLLGAGGYVYDKKLFGGRFFEEQTFGFKCPQCSGPRVGRASMGIHPPFFRPLFLPCFQTNPQKKPAVSLFIPALTNTCDAHNSTSTRGKERSVSNREEPERRLEARAESSSPRFENHLCGQKNNGSTREFDGEREREHPCVSLEMVRRVLSESRVSSVRCGVSLFADVSDARVFARRRRRYAKMVGDTVGVTLDGGDGPILFWSGMGFLVRRRRPRVFPERPSPNDPPRTTTFLWTMRVDRASPARLAPNTRSPSPSARGPRSTSPASPSSRPCTPAPCSRRRRASPHRPAARWSHTGLETYS